MTLGEYTDRIPEEAYEPHDALVLDVHVAFAIEVRFEQPPVDQAVWHAALISCIEDRITNPAWVGLSHEDLVQWAVVDVEKEEHEHEWGPVEMARMTGNLHRKCQQAGCRWITMELEDGEVDE